MEDRTAWNGEERRQTAVDIAVMQNDLKAIKASVEHVEKELEVKYVTMDQFIPIQRLVYGIVAVVGTAFLLALVALVIKGVH
jgi:hypothetical protein